MTSAGLIPSRHALFSCRRPRPNETLWQQVKRSLLERRKINDPYGELGFTDEMQRWCLEELQEPVRLEYLISMTAMQTVVFGRPLDEQPEEITYKRSFTPYLVFGNADDLLLFMLFWA